MKKTVPTVSFQPSLCYSVLLGLPPSTNPSPVPQPYHFHAHSQAQAQALPRILALVLVPAGHVCALCVVVVLVLVADFASFTSLPLLLLLLLPSFLLTLSNLASPSVSLPISLSLVPISFFRSVSLSLFFSPHSLSSFFFFFPLSLSLSLSRCISAPSGWSFANF